MENLTELIKKQPSNAFLKSVTIAFPDALVIKYIKRERLSIKVEWIDSIAFKNLVSIEKMYRQTVTIHPVHTKMAVMFTQKEVKSC